MAIIPVTKDDVENFTIVTTPRRTFTFSSGSYGQRVTGSIKIYPRYSTNQKDVLPVFEQGNANDQTFISDYDNINNNVRQQRSSGALKTNSLLNLNTYLEKVHNVGIRTNYTSSIERFSPLDFYSDTRSVSRYTLAKNTIKDILMPYYKTQYSHANWSYSNYHSLNFFTVSKTSQTIPTASVLLYPNVQNSLLPKQTGYASGTYCLSGAFSFEFHINPRYQSDGLDSGHFKAGTIFHLSSSYALSLITGSAKDPTGLPVGFRLQLQLSHSADISPSLASQGIYPSNLVFVSDDNSLEWNNWHHVAVRWGTNTVNDGTGSFVIDGVKRGYFVVPSGTINVNTSNVKSNPDSLCIGNFYEGTNKDNASQNRFFAYDISRANGATPLLSASASSLDEPTAYAFNHPLKAEMHDLMIKRYYVDDNEISVSGSSGIGGLASDRNDLAFYLPPFFVQESAIRRKHKTTQGGVLQTPFHTISGTTDDPFNVAMAFGVNGHYINLENFVRDFTNSQYPRLINLTGSVQSSNNSQVNANNILYQMNNVAKRNLSILPCDDGSFEPSFEILKSERYKDKYKTMTGKLTDLSAILLEDLVMTSSTILNNSDPDKSNYSGFVSQLYGPTPDDSNVVIGSKLQNAYNKLGAEIDNAISDSELNRGIFKDLPLPIFDNLRDASSNQVTIFNISNIFYGKRILPGSFTLTDSAISGSQGAVKITIKDDSLGNLYRADAITQQYTQNSIGNIFYDEGIVVIKNPHLFFFGKQQYEVAFKGVSNIYSTKYEILAGSGQLNSSSNPSYALEKNNLRASGDPIDKDVFVYISSVNLHDENMNVVAKVKLAQPIIKRFADKILFKIAIDY